jgi:hypothetical protein
MTVVKIGNRYYQQSPPSSSPAPVYAEPSLPPTSTAVRTAPRKEDRSCRCSEVDEYGRHCIGFCGPDCEGRAS